MDIHTSLKKFILHWLDISNSSLHIFSYQLFGNSILKWIFVIFIFSIFLLFKNRLINLIQKILNILLKQLRSTVSIALLSCIYKPIKWAVLLIGFKVSISILTFDKSLTKLTTELFYTLEIILFIWASLLVIGFLQKNHEQLFNKQYNQSTKNIINLFMTFVKIIIIIILLIMMLKAWGYNPSTLLASLGILGMAAALAAQDTTKNIFGAMMIFIDKPFNIGDWIKTLSVEGTIQEIGMRSTKIKTFEDAIVSVPNGVLANEAIINWTKRQRRRIKMNIGLTYSTTSTQMTNILKQIRELLMADEDIHPQTIFVNFLDFNDSSLGILCYFFTKTVDWGEYMNIRERINLEFMRIVEENGSSFAFPSRTIYLQNQK